MKQQAAQLEIACDLLKAAEEIALWHVSDGDECGVIARDFLARFEAFMLAQSNEQTPRQG